MNIGYADFRLLCEVDDTEDWVPWLSVRGDGVYVKEPPASLLASEAAALSAHPTGNLGGPALCFPCTLSELDSFLTEHSQYQCIDPFVMAEWVQRQIKETEKRDRAAKSLKTTNHGHDFDKLATLNLAAARFWANADREDRGTHPKNSAVAAWLIESGYSQGLADKAASIIRPEWAPSGRKPEE